MFSDLMQSCAKASSSFLNLALGIKNFVARLKRSLLYSMNGFVKFSIVVITCYMLASSREITEVDKV